jgi:predicted PurR-regulated permease PerM
MVKIEKITQPLFLIVLIIGLLMILKGFLIPLSFGLLIALIVYPICKKLENKKIPKPIAIFISILFVALIFFTIVLIFVWQLNAINKEVPELTIKLNQLLIDAQKWVDTTLGLSVAEQNSLVTSTGKNLVSNFGRVVSGSFSIASETLFNLIIIPIYTMLILYYRVLLVRFIGSFLSEKYKENLPKILSETIKVYFNYIKGMVLVYFIVGVLNSIGLLILGVEHAILFGMTSALMTIIPYVGILISSIIPVSMVWIEKGNGLYPLGVIGVFSIVQFLEGNIISPYIIGKQLGINAFASITAIFLGGLLWGFSGMILFLPFAAILKIISGHIDGLKPIDLLLKTPLKKNQHG